MSGQHNNQKSKIRMPIIRRVDKPVQNELGTESESQSWAVSYADLLMVLLSFFILFFSVDQSKRDGLVDNIILAAGFENTLKTAEGGGGGSTLDVGIGKGTGGAPAMNTLGEDIQNSFQGLIVNVEKEEKKVTLRFPHNIFSKGAVQLKPGDVEKVTKIFSRLKDYQDKFMISVVGHTDAELVVRARTESIQTNLDLSLVRAGKISSLAVKTGFLPARIRAEGSGPNEYNSRSFSIVIRMAETVAAGPAPEKQDSPKTEPVKTEPIKTTEKTTEIREPAAVEATASVAPFEIQARILGELSKQAIPAKSLSDGEAIIVDLPDNFFSEGKYCLNDQQKEKLNAVFTCLKTFESQVKKIVFIGHSDGLPVTGPNQSYYSTNGELSKKRALKVAEWAVISGFDVNRLSSEAAESTLRNTRSVSIRIKLLSHDQKKNLQG